MSDYKFDDGKLRFDLLEPKFIRDMAGVMLLGATKYATNSWQNVPNARARYVAALHRHLNAWQCGELVDSESRLSHMAHVAVNAMFLHWFSSESVNDDEDCYERQPLLPFGD